MTDHFFKQKISKKIPPERRRRSGDISFLRGPAAAAIAVTVGPAVAMTPAAHDVRTANHGADHATNNRAGGARDHGAGTGTDRNAFNRAGLRREWHRSQRHYE
jgi:hypothetical protein